MLRQPELLRLYAQINADWFGSELPPCQLKWSRQLTRAAGNIDVKNRVIKLSVPLLIDAFELKQEGFEICGVRCDSREIALEEILKHEMIHLWLHERGLPSGHTAQFRLKARQIGQPKTRHAIARPAAEIGLDLSLREVRGANHEAAAFLVGPSRARRVAKRIMVGSSTRDFA